MLSRPATKISLTADDIAAYEQRKLTRDSLQAQEMDSSQESQKSGASSEAVGLTPAAQARAAKAKLTREQRIGMGNARS